MLSSMAASGFIAVARPTRAQQAPAGAPMRTINDFDGDVVLPGDPDYETAKQLHIGQFDAINPTAICYCYSAKQVAQVLDYCRRQSVSFRVRSGGHSLGGYSTVAGVVLDVSRMNSVSSTHGLVAVQAGAQQVDVLAAMKDSGDTLPGGVCPTVAPGGYYQGGGIGLLTRQHGLGIDRLSSIEIVTADGKLRTCNSQKNSDLFWALRGGGGGNFGVVTEYVLRPVPTPSMVNIQMSFDWAMAAKVVSSWQHRLVAEAPRELAMLLGLMWTDAGTGAPEVVLSGTFSGAQNKAEHLMESFLKKSSLAPSAHSFTTMSYFDTMMSWYGCSELSVSACHRVGYNAEAALPRENFVADRNRMFDRTLDNEAIARIIRQFESSPRPGQFRYVSFFPLGGAIRDMPHDATAYAHRRADFFVGFTMGLSTPQPSLEDRIAAETWVNQGFNILNAKSYGGSYINFIDPKLRDWEVSYYGDHLARLRAVKSAVDPDSLFRFPKGLAK